MFCKNTASKPGAGQSVAIIGISGRFPQASGMREYWDNLVQGRDCIEEIRSDRWNWKAIYGDPVNEVNKIKYIISNVHISLPETMIQLMQLEDKQIR